MSNYVCSHNVFKRYLLLMCQKEFLWSKGLNVHLHLFLIGSLKCWTIVQSISCEPFPKQSLGFTRWQSKSFENTVAKGENACDTQFLLFPTVFSNFLPFSSNSKLLSANSFSLEESTICHLGKGPPNYKIFH